MDNRSKQRYLCKCIENINHSTHKSQGKQRTGKSYQNVLAREFQRETESNVLQNAGIKKINEKRAND